jgi:hypothetical protein
MDKEQRSDNSDCGKPAILALGARLAMSHPRFFRCCGGKITGPRRPGDGTRFVLVRTSHPGNVGATARAMKVMGFSDLVLVAPRFADVLQHEDTVAMASGATDVLAQARIVPTLAEALDGITWACATAMTPRDFGPPTHAPRAHFAELAPQGHRVAFVFGSERFGLGNEDVYRCHASRSHRSVLRLAEPGPGGAGAGLRLAPGPGRLWRAAAHGAGAVGRWRGDPGPAGALAAGAGGHRLSGPGRAQEAAAAPEPAGQPRPADPGGGAHPARHRPGHAEARLRRAKSPEPGRIRGARLH